ncbi:MAG: DUF6383 domain-containing protein [Tannerellaceae bacterium]|jgi:hypothetical protein|nr:DUF6383 domain-containing protein [Tannerellaceae bacterium]
MNKKFFTLIAGAFMLAASLGTAKAQGYIPTDTVTDGLSTQAQKYLYHLVGKVNGTGVEYFLVVQNDGSLVLKTTTEYGDGEYAFGNALWCVNVSDQEDQGLNPTFVFENKGAGLKLGVSKDDERLLGSDSIDIRFGALTRFEFSRTYKNALEAEKPLKLYYNTDSVLTFVKGTTGQIGVRSYSATDPEVTGVGSGYGKDVVLFSLYRPDEVNLTADQFNTILNTERNGWVTLNFVPAPTDKSEFQTAIKAEDATTAPAPGNWLLFFQNTADLSKKYLRVDTAYTGEYGTKFLKFAFGDGPSTGSPQKTAIANQYYFQARYHVLNDSLAIDVHQAIFPTEKYDGYWYEYPHKTEWNVTAGTFPGSDSLHVKLQDLIAGERSLLTIGTKEVSTRIELGLKSCSSVPVNLTSVPSNLYTIKNDAGQYLVVLINTDTLLRSQRSAPRWMTLNEATQNPNRIPAFQWVVEQTRTDFPNSSPILITNREFGFIELGISADYHEFVDPVTIQLRTTGSTLYGDVSIKATNFQAVPDLEKGDKYLGYKYLPDDSLKFNTYDFNYLNELNAEKYLFIKNTADSSIYLNTTTQSRTQFELIAQGTPKRYGYWTAAVPGLSKLEKVSYVLRVKDGYALNRTGAVVTPDGEGRYAVSKVAADTSIFLLKTNNTKEGRDYYALLDTGAYGARYNDVVKDVKLGIDDANAWAYEQDLNEFRTSTFYIAPYNEPLYRRFDNGEYGKYKIKEPYGDASNAPVWLKFAKHNNWGTEFLFENSPRGNGSKDPNKTNENDYRDELTAKGKATISFLGLYNKADYPENGELSNYTFYVDTAYVRYATPMPQYMLAVRPEFVTGDTIYRITKDSVWDSSGRTLLYVTSDTTISIRPSFTRAFYVFNAQDSLGSILNPYQTDARNKDYVGKLGYGAEYTTRLAFVDGIHMGDTFYVLRNNPATTSIDSAYLLAIPRGDKHYLGANTHYTPRWDRTGTPDLSAANPDAHNGKSMVFQFRLYDPDGTGDQSVDAKMVRKFMIESRQDDGVQIGPMTGRWVKVQNGVPVISDEITLANARQNGAEIFNVLEGEAGKAVGNEKAVVSSDVQVIGGAGAVTILNAGGKKVAISNILGQTVANQVVSSDNATIALPKGIVVIAIDGEAAVKAIVK